MFVVWLGARSLRLGRFRYKSHPSVILSDRLPRMLDWDLACGQLSGLCEMWKLLDASVLCLGIATVAPA